MITTIKTNMMLATTLLFLALITTAHAFIECYPQKDCKEVIPASPKIVIGERHEGIAGLYTIFGNISYCISGKSTHTVHTTLCLDLLPKGNCGDCHGIDPGQCINSPEAGRKFVCAYSN